MVIFLFSFKNIVLAKIEPERQITDLVNKVDFEIEEGNLTFQATSANNIKILAQSQDQSCQDDLKVDNLELKLINKKKRAGCRCDYIIYLPKNIDIVIKSGTANIEINEMIGSLHVKNGSGNVTGNSILEKAIVEVGSGNVFFTVNKASSSIKIGSGDGIINFPIIPQNKIDLEIMIGSGNAQVNISKDAKVEYDIRSMNYYNRSVDDAPNFKIKMMIGTGKANVEKI